MSFCKIRTKSCGLKLKKIICYDFRLTRQFPQLGPSGVGPSHPCLVFGGSAALQWFPSASCGISFPTSKSELCNVAVSCFKKSASEGKPGSVSLSRLGSTPAFSRTWWGGRPSYNSLLSLSSLLIELTRCILSKKSHHLGNQRIRIIFTRMLYLHSFNFDCSVAGEKGTI